MASQIVDRLAAGGRLATIALSLALPPGLSANDTPAQPDLMQRLMLQAEEQMESGFREGQKHELGQGVPQNFREAAKWYELAADQGSWVAQSSLGKLYFRGQGVARDPVKAYVWLRLSTREMDVWNPPDEPPLNELKAVDALLSPEQRAAADVQVQEWKPKWLREVDAHVREARNAMLARAEQGDAAAQFEVGEWYAGGHGVPEDEGKAREWYRRAAEQGHAKAQATLGSDLYYATLNGQLPDEHYTEAFRWLTKGAQQGQITAQMSLADMYEFGRGAPQDWSKKIYWHTQASEQGHPYAAQSLSDDYWYGRGVTKDPAKAYSWMKIGTRHAPGTDRGRLAESAALLTAEQQAAVDRDVAAWKPHGPDCASINQEACDPR